MLAQLVGVPWLGAEAEPTQGEHFGTLHADDDSLGGQGRDISEYFNEKWSISVREMIDRVNEEDVPFGRGRIS